MIELLVVLCRSGFHVLTDAVDMALMQLARLSFLCLAEAFVCSEGHFGIEHQVFAFRQVDDEIRGVFVFRCRKSWLEVPVVPLCNPAFSRINSSCSPSRPEFCCPFRALFRGCWRVRAQLLIQFPGGVRSLLRPTLVFGSSRETPLYAVFSDLICHAAGTGYAVAVPGLEGKLGFSPPAAG